MTSGSEGRRLPGRQPAGRCETFPVSMTPGEDFADLQEANAAYAAQFQPVEWTGTVARALAVVTCMDARIDPLRVLGLAPGDAKILRNAGARVTTDVLGDLVLAVHLLGVRRVLVLAHTQCAMASGPPEALHARIAADGGPDTRSLTFRAAPDQEATLRADVDRVRAWPYLGGVAVGGARFDVATGRVEWLA